MQNRFSLLLLIAACLSSAPMGGYAQDNNTTEQSDKPVILYNGTPKKYEIADIKVSGVKNYEDYVLIGISGLAVGQTGGIAQLGEHLLCKQGVRSSILLISTKKGA